jgi:hypothetical protein
MKTKRGIVFLSLTLLSVSLLVSVFSFAFMDRHQTMPLIFQAFISISAGAVLAFFFSLTEYHQKKQESIHMFILKTNMICQDLLPIAYFFREGDHITNETFAVMDNVKNAYNANDIFIRPFSFLFFWSATSKKLIENITAIQTMLSKAYEEIFEIVNELHKCKLRHTCKSHAEFLLHKFLNETFLIGDANCLVVRINALNSEIKDLVGLEHTNDLQMDFLSRGGDS